jgi:hypothetical protein
MPAILKSTHNVDGEGSVTLYAQWATFIEGLVMSKRNRKDIPVRTYNGSNFFRVSREEADYMLAHRQAFVLAECPRELQLMQGPPLAPPPLTPDLSLLMSPTVIRSASQPKAGHAAKATVEGWGGRRTDFRWSTIHSEQGEVRVRVRVPKERAECKLREA